MDSSSKPGGGFGIFLRLAGRRLVQDNDISTFGIPRSVLTPHAFAAEVIFGTHRFLVSRPFPSILFFHTFFGQCSFGDRACRGERFLRAEGTRRDLAPESGA